MKRYLIVIIFCAFQVQAQWSNDPTVNSPVFTGPNPQYGVNAVSDGQAGAFVFWFHQETGATGIYAQRIDASGKRIRPQPTQIFQYPLTGTVSKEAIADGSQGTIIVWSAKVTGSITDADIYAQRLDQNVDSSWGQYVTVCNSINLQSRPSLTSDDSGGTIIAWEDRRTAGVSKIYAQRLNAFGKLPPTWPTNGILLCNTTSQAQFKPMVVSDGNHGAIIVWEDIRNFQNRLYAQRINAAGELQWADTGTAVYFYPTAPTLRGLVADGVGGAFVCWQDRNSHGDDNVYVQRIDSEGNRVWDPFGVRVSFSDNDVNPLLVSDSNGGAIVAWEDSSLGIHNINIYAQRVTRSGTLAWTSSVPVSIADSNQYYFSMIPRGNNGAIIAWTDTRNWPTPTGLDIYAQSLDSTGTTQWQTNGTPVSQPPALSFSLSAQMFPALAGDGSGGAIAFWDDNRNSGNATDIYTQGIAALGLPLVLTSSITQINTNYAFSITGNTLLTANFGTLGTMDSMTVQAFINAAPPGLNKALPRYFDLAANGSGFNATITFNYTDADVAATGINNHDTNLKMYRNSGAGWTLQGGIVDTLANTITLNDVTGFSLWAMRDPTDTIVTTVRAKTDIPGRFGLQQNYPNPFNPSTTIRYGLPKASDVSLKIYNMLGQQVAVLVEEEQLAGTYEIVFDGSHLASGMYFYEIHAGNFIETKKFVLLK